MTEQDDKKNKRRKLNRDVNFLQRTVENRLVPTTSHLTSDIQREMLSMMRRDLDRRETTLSGAQEATASSQASPTVGLNEEESNMHHYLIVAAPQELDAVVTWVEKKGWKIKKMPIANHSGRQFEALLSTGVTIKLGLICAGEKGALKTSELISDIVRFESPYSVIMTGMMGGIPGKSKILDVVCPEGIYDGRAIGTKNKKLVRESKAEAQHSRFSDIVKNLGPVLHENSAVNIVKTKNSITVGAKIDEIEHALVKTMITVDPENLVGVEMEGFAVASAARHQQLHDENVVFGVIKGVADLCSTVDEVDADSMSQIEKFVSLDDIEGKLNPTENKDLKKKLQETSTHLTCEVVVNVIEMLESFRVK